MEQLRFRLRHPAASSYALALALADCRPEALLVDGRGFWDRAGSAVLFDISADQQALEQRRIPGTSAQASKPVKRILPRKLLLWLGRLEGGAVNR